MDASTSDVDVNNTDKDGAPHEELDINDQSSLIAKLEGQFHCGNVVPGIDECYLLYAEYGSCMGFGVRRGKQIFFKGTNVIRRKEFYCSCNGFFENKKDPINVTRKYSKQHVRSGCPALLRIVRAVGQPWVVTKFVKQHNHELLSPDDSYLLRSSRNLECNKTAVLDALHSAGIGVARSFRFMENQAGGVQYVGFTKKDAFNHADSLKHLTRVQNGDARALMNFCMDASNSEQSFYWSVKLDSEGRLMHIFFRDSRCLIDYETFSDVLLVDTTYRTNKYDIVVAPFVGVNHHRQNILFGVGFLSTETTTSFRWLFSAFLNSMKGIQPQVIFTDQCQAMMSAIDDVFPNAHHRLCHWHISRNQSAHFGALNRNNEFLHKWRRCMKGVESVEEFEELWAHMLTQYDLNDNSWFSAMYKLKRRWASVFTQNYFSCGMIATSRCEATNRSLKQSCESTNCLFEFVQCYERMKSDWRNREAAADVSNVGNPGRCAASNPILLKASRTLTRAAYLLFERQMIRMLSYDIVAEKFKEAEGVLEYKVVRMLDSSDAETGEMYDEDLDDDTEVNLCEDNDQETDGRARTVNFDWVTNRASCTCKLWETLGILCRHILKVYNTRRVNVLPDCYLLPRWCKDAKIRLLESRRQSSPGSKSDCIERLAYVNHFMRLAKEVADECQYFTSCRNDSLSNMVELRRSMGDKIVSNRRSLEGGEQVGVESEMIGVKQFRDPPPSNRRGKTKQSQETPKSH